MNAVTSLGLPAQARTFPSSRAAAGEGSFGSPPAADSFKSSDGLKVRENEWYLGHLEDSYVISTGGCGAVKVFVESGSSSYCVVFHSFGDAQAREVGRRIGSSIARQRERPEAVKILCLQPYDISQDVMDSVNEIRDSVEEGGIPTSVHVVRLNNIDHERYSAFVELDMGGTEEQILSRYDDLVLKDRPMSEADRAQKVELFQSVPPTYRTPEFLKRWSGLSLDEAREVVEEIEDTDQSWARRLFSGFRLADGRLS